ncbi:MAG: caspase family protein [Cyclobacteriaceae bacterium]|nr:caspase family protein [Cyclobacteriaceae bacterium]
MWRLLSITLLWAMATGSMAQDIYLYPYKKVSIGSKAIRSISFSTLPKWVAVETDGMLTIRSVDDGREVKSLPSKSAIALHDFIDSDKVFLYFDEKGQLVEFSMDNLSVTHSLSLDKEIRLSCLDPTAQYLSWVNGSNEIQIYDIKADMTAGRVAANPRIKKAKFVGYDRFGQQLAAISDIGDAFTYNPLNQRLLRQLKLQSGEVANSKSIIHSVATNSGGDKFLVGLQEVNLQKGASQGAQPRPVAPGQPSQTGPQVYSFGGLERRNMIVVYDWSTGEEVKRFPLRYRIDGMALGPGPNHVAYFSEDSKSINLLNLDKATIGSTVAVDDKPTAIALSDDGEMLAVGTAKGTLNLFEVVRNDPPEIRILKPGVSRGLGDHVVHEADLRIEGAIEGGDRIEKVFVNGEPANFNFGKDFSADVTLEKGKNRITITVQNTEAQVTDKDFYVTYEPRNAPVKEKIPGGPQKFKGKRLALVIGNAEYSSNAKLRNTRNDAASMAVELQALGFEVMKVLDGTYEQMKNAIYAFGDKAQTVDVSVFFYAGHGLEVDGTNYLVPVDADIQSALDVKQKAIPLTGVIRTMEFANDEGLNMIILDACRNNPFPTGKRSSGSGLARIQTPSGTLIAYSTDPGSVASDGDRENGLYTGELIKQLSISQRIEDVFMNTRNAVERMSNGAQRPWEEARLKGVFYLK